MADVVLGVLDFGDLDPIEIARAAEALGYARFWLAEHHDGAGYYADPLMMSALVAAVTDSIRVGPAGVLVRFHSPLAIAESARLLEHFNPGRIDLGLAYGDAPPQYRERLLDGRPPASRDELAARSAEVVAILRRQRPVVAVPVQDAITPTWVLGGSIGSAKLAGALGAGFCASLIHGDVLPDNNVLDAYRDAFAPAPERPEPRAAIAMAGRCSERALGGASGSASVRTTYAGRAEDCAAIVREMIARYHADEAVHLDESRTLENRLISLRLLAGACRLAS